MAQAVSAQRTQRHSRQQLLQQLMVLRQLAGRSAAQQAEQRLDPAAARRQRFQLVNQPWRLRQENAVAVI
jgi:hypothetical protein